MSMRNATNHRGIPPPPAARAVEAHDPSLKTTVIRMTILAATLTLVALLTGALNGPHPIAAGAATIAFAGFSAAAVSEALRRRKPRLQSTRSAPSSSRTNAGTLSSGRRHDMPGAMNRLDRPGRDPFWKSHWVTIAVAISTASLFVGLLLPDRFAAPLLGFGLVGLLATRMFAAESWRNSRTRHHIDELAPVRVRTSTYQGVVDRDHRAVERGIFGRATAA